MLQVRKTIMLSLTMENSFVREEDCVRCSMLVEKIIDKPCKTSMWDKVKINLWKNRMHFICKK